MFPRIRIATVIMALSFGAARADDAKPIEIKPDAKPTAVAPAAPVQGGCGCAAQAPTCGCEPRCCNSWHVRGHCHHLHLFCWHPGHLLHAFTIGSGCVNPVGCGCFASERTFLFGSCRQFYHPGNTCGGYGHGCGCHYYGPYGYGNLGTYDNCIYSSYMNR